MAEAGTQAILFDFDGVILETVMLKEEQFRAMAARMVPDRLPEAMEYFWTHGGISRVEKFRWIAAHLAGKPISDQAANALGGEFAARVRGGVLSCPFVKGAEEFLRRYHDRVRLFVISGTPDAELKSIVAARGIDRYFRGVFGSPRSKIEIGEAILASEGIDRSRAVFVGDATTDRDAARALGMRFVGIAGPHLSPFLDGTETMIADLSGLPAALGLED